MKLTLILVGLIAIPALMFWIYARSGLVLAFGLIGLAFICELVDRVAGPEWKWLIATVLLLGGIGIRWRSRRK